MKLTPALALVLTAALCREAAAQPVVDQSFLTGPAGVSGLEVTSNQWVAQTFTVGITGQLASVAVAVREHRCVGTNDLTIKVVTTDAMGVPEVLSPPLATIVVPTGSVSPLGGPFALFVFNVLSFGIPVNVGDELGILLETSAPAGMCTYAWNAQIGGYAAGSSYLISGPPGAASPHVRDMGFETTVIVGLPSCTIAAPAGGTLVTGEVAASVDGDDPQGDPVTLTFEASTNSGATWLLATPGPTSPLSNPSAPLSTPFTAADFLWDSRGDGVGISLVTPTILRVTIDDGATTPSCSVNIDVDNTQLCSGICGDCNLNAQGPDVIDALTASQVAAGLIVPTVEQRACCDVNSSGAVDVLDALLIAQSAAGLAVVLACA